MRLVDHYMETKQALPDSDNALARICGVSISDFAPHSEIIRAFFEAENGKLFHETCEEILTEQNGGGYARKNRASKAAKKRWENSKRNQEVNADPHAQGMLGNATEQNITEEKKDILKKDITFTLVSEDACGVVTVPKENFSEAVEVYNAMAETAGLPRCQSLTEKRKTALKKRMNECGGMEGWRVAMDKVAASAFLTGAGDRGWRANFDFVLQQQSFTKLMEGTYDDRKSTNNKPKSATDALVAGFDKAADILQRMEDNGNR